MADVLHVTSEVVPFSKTGGLADVSAALPEALARRGNKVAVVTPLYRTIDVARHGIRPAGLRFPVTLGGRTCDFTVHEVALPGGTIVYFLECDALYGRAELYGTRDGDYPDNHLRFAFFAAATFRLVRALQRRPDVIHGHDWQAGLVPAFNRLTHLELSGTVLTIHNLAYQGLFPAEVVPAVGLPWESFRAYGGAEFWGRLSFLKAGLVNADAVTTVSPTYAREVCTRAGGVGMDGILRALGDRFTGILNGADYGAWDPSTDTLLPARYSAADMSGKAICRGRLLAEFGLPDAGGPMFGVVGRLTSQKGHDLLAQCLDDLVDAGGSLVVLGTGERIVEDQFRAAAARHPGRVALRVAYDEPLAHLVEAGSDFFVMPSRFEPCGLNQIYSMRYGTLPMVHATGGLEDTVRDVDEEPGRGTGLKFRAFERAALAWSIRRARDLWDDKARFAETRRRAMAEDFSWEASARAYEALYERVAR
jgi:starch synthase